MILLPAQKKQKVLTVPQVVIRKTSLFTFLLEVLIFLNEAEPVLVKLSSLTSLTKPLRINMHL